jgi:hypothetical protein
MVSLSVSVPQVAKFAVQPKTSAVATAVPCLKVSLQRSRELGR